MTDEKMRMLKSEGIDVYASLERLGDDMELLDTIIGLFLTDSNMKKFEESVEADEREDAYNAVHTMKSLSANLSMSTLNELCVKACELYKSGDYDGCADLLMPIKTEHTRVLRILRDL